MEMEQMQVKKLVGLHATYQLLVVDWFGDGIGYLMGTYIQAPNGKLARWDYKLYAFFKIDREKGMRKQKVPLDIWVDAQTALDMKGTCLA